MPPADVITIQVPPSLDAALTAALTPLPIEELELEAAAPQGLCLPLDEDGDWQTFARTVRDIYGRYDHVVLRGLPALPEGRALMAAISILGNRFTTYGKGQVVKVFAMSPWSRDLAHAGAEGFFHTDLNASPTPPALTGIQCVEPDPGAPDYGFNRVVRLDDLLAELRSQGAINAIAFLTEQEVEMANERSPTSWRGRIVDNGILRFHPETIRAASHRQYRSPPDDILYAIQRAAVAASAPISLGRGDTLLFSNHRTLHYRSECSVSFINFPMEFKARRIYVLHVREERLRA